VLDQLGYWRQVFSTFTYWRISIEAAQQAGIWRYGFARQGRALTTLDTLNAAVAVEADATLVTRNIEDYPMQDVQLQAV
jgi:predicted nucleic acid-binding protein